MKRILITGANGFVGSFYVEEALRRGWEVWAGVRKTSSREFLTDPRIHFIDLKYADAADLQKQVGQHIAEHGKWNYVIHNAGITKSALDADFDRVNHVYSLNLIDALRRSGDKPEKFVYMSSLAASGPGDKPRPDSAYGRSKIETEQYLQSLPDFPFIILRPTGVYGPREKDYYVMCKMVNSGLDVAVGRQPQMLNFIYIKDLVKACFSALESPIQNKVWFVADGDTYTSQHYTQILKEVLHKKHVLKITVPLSIAKIASVFAGLYCQITKRPSLINPDKIKIMKQRDWTCDTSSLEKDLGFKAEYNLRRGLEETVAWYKDHGWI